MPEIGIPFGLILRSGPKGRVSKDENEHLLCCPSFETRSCGALLRMRPDGITFSSEGF
jgi:hypothetical protein